jgi:hypothetical protein
LLTCWKLSIYLIIQVCVRQLRLVVWNIMITSTLRLK